MQMKRLLSMTLGLLMSMTQVIAETKITVLSDIHVMAPELIVNNGSAWQNYLAGKRTMLDYSTQLFDELIPQLIADKPDLLLITGDLTKDGEQVSHQLVVKQLDRLRASGIRVLVIPGDHDLGTETAYIFDGDKTSLAKTVDSNAFAEMYQQYGYGASSDRDTESLTYCCEPVDGLVVIGIACDRHGRMSNSTLSWVCNRAEKARSEGKQVLAMMHFLLFPHVSNIEKTNEDYIVKDYETVRDRLIESGVRVVLTGHFHVQEIARDLNDNLTCDIYEIITSSTAAYPCGYRQMTLSNDKTKLSVKSKNITSLSGVPDFQNVAKERLKEGTTNLFISEEVNSETAGDLVAQGFVIHAAGNEDKSSESQTYLTFYELTQLVLRLTGVMNSKFDELGLTWDFVNTTVRSMLTDTSRYGIPGREDRTDDLSVTIDLPKPTTGIHVVESNQTIGKCYNLQGQQLITPPKGLYIQEGKLKMRKNPTE